MHRNLHFDSVSHNPYKTRLLSKDIQQHLFRAVFCPLNKHATKGKAPTENGTWQKLQRGQTADHDKRVEHIAANPFFLNDQLVRALKAWDRCVGKHRC